MDVLNEVKLRVQFYIRGCSDSIPSTSFFMEFFLFSSTELELYS